MQPPRHRRDPKQTPAFLIPLSPSPLPTTKKKEKKREGEEGGRRGGGEGELSREYQWIVVRSVQ